MGRSVPSVGTVHDDGNAFVNGVGNEARSVEHRADVLQPSRRLQRAQELIHRFLLARLDQLLKTRSHDVDVLDAQEVELRVLVEQLVLVSFPSRPVCHRVDLGKVLG